MIFCQGISEKENEKPFSFITSIIQDVRKINYPVLFFFFLAVIDLSIRAGIEDGSLFLSEVLSDFFFREDYRRG